MGFVLTFESAVPQFNSLCSVSKRHFFVIEEESFLIIMGFFFIPPTPFRASELIFLTHFHTSGTAAAFLSMGLRFECRDA